MMPQYIPMDRPGRVRRADIGSRVNVEGVGHAKLRFVGSTSFEAEQIWCGVELDTPTGRNDGTVQGRFYFECRPQHGLFVRIDRVKVERARPVVVEAPVAVVRNRYAAPADLRFPQRDLIRAILNQNRDDGHVPLLPDGRRVPPPGYRYRDRIRNDLLPAFMAPQKFRLRGHDLIWIGHEDPWAGLDQNISNPLMTMYNHSPTDYVLRELDSALRCRRCLCLKGQLCLCPKCFEVAGCSDCMAEQTNLECTRCKQKPDVPALSFLSTGAFSDVVAILANVDPEDIESRLRSVEELKTEIKRVNECGLCLYTKPLVIVCGNCRHVAGCLDCMKNVRRRHQDGEDGCSFCIRCRGDLWSGSDRLNPMPTGVGCRVFEGVLKIFASANAADTSILVAPN